MKTILIIVAVALVGLIGFGVAYNYINTGNAIPSTTSVASGDLLTLTISGEITRPGTYVLSNGATMIDLITAASGTTSNADTLAFDSSFVLSNKGSYYIAPVYDNSNACALEPISKANINTDDASTLQAVAGFSKSASQAIVSYRASATFECIEQIKDVPGIGQATYISVRDKITLRSAEA